MRTVHPAYDPITQSWFVEGKEARTLARLQRLLPDCEFIGYDPNGNWQPPVPPKVELSPDIIERSYSKPKAAPPPPAIKPTVSQPTVSPPYKGPPKLEDNPAKKVGRPMGADRKYDHDTVLAHWAAGMTNREIANLMNMPPGSVSQIVYDYRKRGDARAARRYL